MSHLRGLLRCIMPAQALCSGATGFDEQVVEKPKPSPSKASPAKEPSRLGDQKVTSIKPPPKPIVEDLDDGEISPMDPSPVVSTRLLQCFQCVAFNVLFGLNCPHTIMPHNCKHALWFAEWLSC